MHAVPAAPCAVYQVMKQLERMFGEGANSALTFSSHRWGEQPLTSGNRGGTGGGHDDMGDPDLRVPFVSSIRCISPHDTANPQFPTRLIFVHVKPFPANPVSRGGGVARRPGEWFGKNSARASRRLKRRSVAPL